MSAAQCCRMRIRLMRHIGDFIILALFPLFMLPAIAEDLADYRFVELVAPSSAFDRQTIGFSMNAIAQVAGSSGIVSEHILTIWQPNGSPTVPDDLNHPGIGFIWGINDAGVVVGDIRDTATFEHRGFVWDSGTLNILPEPVIPEGAVDCSAAEINNAGIIAGHCYLESDYNASIAVQWVNGLPVLQDDLPTALPQTYPAGYHMNAQGVVVWHSDEVIPQRGYVWRSTGASELPVLPGRESEAVEVTDINDSDEIVGAIGDAPVVWRNDVPELLPLEGGTVGIAVGINNLGDIIGEIDSDPVMWRGNKIYRLNDYLPRSETPADFVSFSPYKINDNGVILGRGIFNSNANRGILLFPSNANPQIFAVPFVPVMFIVVLTSTVLALSLLGPGLWRLR